MTFRRTSWAFLLHTIALGAHAFDCNQNGTDDASDLAQGTSRDVNGNGVPDECDIERDVFGFAVSSQLDLGPKTIFADLADMDLDGMPDIVAIEPDAARVFLLKERGELRSVVTTKPSTGSFREVEHAVVEDLDEDGDPDVAAAGRRELILLRDAGQGRLELEARLENGSDPAYVTVADLNADGRMDILTANSIFGALPDNFSIYLSQGDLQLADPLQFVAGKLHGAAVARDFDGDGDLDWALALRDARAVRVHLNGGSGVQIHTVDSPALPGDATTDKLLAGDLKAADWNGDGRVDLAVHVISDVWDDLSAWYGLPGDGRGGFGEPRSFDPPVSGRVIAWSDLDGDGNIDLLSAETDHRAVRIQVLRGLAGGVRGPAIEVNEGLTWDGPRYAPPQSLRAADLDGDGDLDLTAVHWHQGRDVYGWVSVESAWVRFLLNRGTSDCNRNAIPDSAEPDCNRTGWPDECDALEGPGIDCDQNGFPDICEGLDRNRNGLSDLCEIRDGTAQDCNQNDVPDEQDLEPRFLLDSPYGTAYGGEPFSAGVAAADFDQDSDLDWITFVDPWGSGRSIELDYHENRGDRELILRREQFELSSVQSVLAADLGGDGVRDLILASGGRDFARVQVQRNDGSGHFTTWSQHVIQLGARASQPAFAVGDLDGDGLADVAVVRDEVWILRGRADGTLAPATQSQRDPLPIPPGDVAPLDADGDGYLDLAMAGGAVLMNRRAGAFFEIRPFPAGHSATRVLGIAAANFDGDGDFDLLTSVLAFNDGNGSFREGPRLAGWIGPVLARDWDADGDMDAVLPAVPRVVLNRGFGDLRDSITLPRAVREWILEAADVDGDGFLDLLSVPGPPEVRWGQPDPRVPEPALLGDWSEVEFVGVSDLEGDGDDDFILRRYWPAPAFVLGVSDGRGSFEAQPGPPVESLLPVGARDLDGDGASELIAREGTRLVVMHGIQGERVEERIDIELGGKDPFNGEGLVQIADLDRDGDLDLALALTEGADSWIQPVLTTARRAHSLGPRSPWLGDRLQGVGDFDGDSDVDLLAQERFLGFFVYANDGSAGFQRRNSGAFRPARRDDVWSPKVGDWDGDGFDDIAAAACLGAGCHGEDCDCVPSVLILRNSGDAQFDIVESHDLAYEGSVSNADLDQDGDLDLLATHTSRYSHRRDETDQGSWLEIFLNDGAGRFRSWGVVGVGVLPGLVLTGDFDGDRFPDIFVQSEFGDVWSFFFNSTVPALLHDRDADGILDECQTRFRRGDWNGDGTVNLSDAVALLGRLFLGGAPSACPKTGDADDSGSLDISDAVWLLHYLFQGGPAPPEPHATCGVDPTQDALSCMDFSQCG